MLLIFWVLLRTVCGLNFKYIAHTPYGLLIYINKTQWKLERARCSLIFTLYVFACTCVQNNNKQKILLLRSMSHYSGIDLYQFLEKDSV